MRTPRLLGILLAALFLAPLAARADDTKPPVISDVKASSRGGKVSVEAKIIDETGVLSAICSYRKAGASKFYDTPMTKNDYDDTFKVSFPGGSDTEYFLQSTDLLGNGPSFYGSAAKPMSLGGKPVAVASNDNPPPQHNDNPPPPEHHATKPPPDDSNNANNNPPPPPPEHHAAKPPDAPPAAAPPVIQHRKPSVALPDGQEFTLRVRITSAAGIKQAVLFARPQGYTGDPSYKAKIPLVSSGGEAYTVVVPADLAHGTVEYFLMALDNAGNRTQLGDPDPSHWFALTFKGGSDNGAAVSQPLVISDFVPGKVAPGQPIHIRAQATLPNATAEMSDQEATDADTKIANATAKILYRTQDTGDASMDMTSDPSGGSAGFQADLPAQQDGAPVYYQIVVCLADQCAIDTGSKHRWNAFSATSGDPQVPNPIKAVSPSAPAGLPE